MTNRTGSVLQSRRRQHGNPPLRVVVVHGGPGAGGEVAPVAQELGARGYGVLEPLQTEASVTGQVEELRNAIEQSCQPPVALIGWSWGAWLVCLLAARHPLLVAKLVLVGSGPFEARHAMSIKPTRLSRLTEAERQEYAVLASDFEDPAKLERAMQLFEKMDTYAPNDEPRPQTEFNKAIHDAVWEEAASLRRSGELLQIIAKIRCPVTAIHGDYDPHPAEGVEIPLRSTLPRSNFVLLDQCGHKPWDEVHARDTFYCELEKAIS